MQFEFTCKSNWPPAAWIARLEPGSQIIRVSHGVRVETNSAWFGELVWDGEFNDGNFHETDVVFGSGARVLNSGSDVTFVGSSSTLDRLNWISSDGCWYVSNSLVCLLARVGASLDPSKLDYYKRFSCILNGIDQSFSIPSSLGTVRLTYFRNLIWDGQTVSEKEKPKIQRSRTSFQVYREFLESTIERVAKNARSTDRQHPFGLMGTASSGFDSPTVASLGRAGGLETVISFADSRGGQIDSGKQIADHLGLETIEVSRNAFQLEPFAEVPFLSADAKGEDVYFSGAQEHLRNNVLLTGYCGSVWGGRSDRYFNLLRTDVSGLSLTEYRLWHGFINFPVPLIGVYQALDLKELMASSEKSEWSTGKLYDKPFCRFVLSGDGVPDDWYGVEKKAASVLLEDQSAFLTGESLKDFQLHYVENRSRLSGVRDLSKKLVQIFVTAGQRMAGHMGRMTSSDALRRIEGSTKLSEFASSDRRFRYLFPWAVNRAVKYYSDSEV